MKQPIQVRGWMSTANIINPRKLFTDELPRYYLAIQPESPMFFDELQEQVDQKKCEAETPYSPTKIIADKIFDSCKVIFQTTIEPRLEGELMDKTYDDELVGKLVQVVGHIHILEVGNAILSMHIVEPAFNSLDGFDPIS
ncbi:hypothetical protein [Prochlorococcus marinus]|uniref:hypothetical protein n=1 Tax=Prochlorococcus marinus TaxID=1219 RepID=UPI0022B3B0C4|nr:hypothetical protein [Prochlorococcus marinus]